MAGDGLFFPTEPPSQSPLRSDRKRQTPYTPVKTRRREPADKKVSGEWRYKADRNIDRRYFADGLFFAGKAGRSRVDEDELVNQLRQLFTIARDHKRSRYDTWMRNYRLVNNRLGGGSSSNWMPAPRDSEIYPVLSALVAWMTDQRIHVDFVPAVDQSSPMYQFSARLASDLSSIFMTTWAVEDYENDLKLSLWDSLTYGIGVTKSVWDNGASGGYGDAVLRRTDPWKFYIDPNATSFRDAEYCVEVRKMSLAEIERRYPGGESLLGGNAGSDLAGIDEAPQLFGTTGRSATGPGMNPGSLPSAGGWPGTGTQVARLAMPSSRSRLYNPLTMYVVYEFWLRENEEWHDDYGLEDAPAFADKHVQDDWRVVVMCNGRILMDEKASDLWSHAQHPYERFVFDDTGEFYGISLVDHLAYPQIYINRLLTAMQYNAELVGNPILLEAAASGTTRIPVANRPGQRLTIQGAQGMANAPKWLDPPQMPSSVMDLIQFWINRIENTSGLSAMQKGAAPNQRSAEKVIQNVQEAAFVRIRSALHNLESALRRSAIKLADLIVDNYTEPRTVAVLGPEGEQTALALNERHFYVPGPEGAVPLKFQLRVEAGGQTPTSRQARVAEALQLYTLGAVDDEYVLHEHGVRNPEKIVQRLYQKRQQGLVGSPGARKQAGRQQ